ncbi:MAG: tRNA lysidine(34) synthetase TilS [Anaerolineae bacterium]
MDVLSQIRRAISQHYLLPHGETVIVGVSGGPDSLCLLHALLALRDEFGCDLHVAHLNHQLRGADADADAHFVSDLATRWQLPSTIGARDVAALAREHKLSIEEAARQARYAFLAEVAEAHHSNTIAVAHNADDQAESVLMHFLRGSGPLGLRGMLPKSEISDLRFLIRPLLSVPRAEVERYCREYDLQPRFDLSNLDTTFFRNRLRHELLPLLETYNPNIRQVLRRTAEVIAAEVEALRDVAENAWGATIVSESDDAITLNLIAWRSLPVAMQRATLREAIRRLRPSLRNVNFVHIEDAVLHLKVARTGARVTLPQRMMLRVDYETFTIADAAREPDLPDWPLLPMRQASKDASLHLEINVPGITLLPGSDWLLEAMHLAAWDDGVFTHPDPWRAYLDADTAGPDLWIRARAHSDVFHPQGMPSPLRLRDWMTNTKIPQHVRDRLPLIVAKDQIAWVAGFRVGQPFLVTPDTRRVLVLSFHR